MALTTDPTPRLTPAEVFQDEHRMKRLKAALCDGLFSYADDQTAARIMDEATKICGGSTETLSEVLQTQFFAQHTPFYWVIKGRPQSKPGPPPLLIRLLSVCDQLNLVTQKEIVAVVYSRGQYNSDVYLAVRLKLTDVPTHEAFQVSPFFPDNRDQPVITQQPSDSANTFSFDIPKFFDRLLVDGEFWFEVPCACYTGSDSIFRVRACLRPVSGSNNPDRLCCQFEVTADHVEPEKLQRMVCQLVLFGSLYIYPEPFTQYSSISQPGRLYIPLSTGKTLEELFWQLKNSDSDCRKLKGKLLLV